MSSSASFIRFVAVGFISGAAGALLVVTLLSDPATSGEDSSKSADDSAWQPRVESLEQSAQEQATALDALLLQRSPANRQGQSSEGPSREEFDQLLARLEGLSLDPSAMPESASSDRLEYAIAGVLEQREEDARQQRERLAEEKRLVRIENQVDYWTERLSLSSVQATQMEEVMLSRDEARQAIALAIATGEMTKMESSEPWQQANEDYRLQLSGILTPQQLQEMDSSGRGVK